MRRRSGASGGADQPQGSATKTPRRNAPKAVSVSAPAASRTKAARLARELAEARERQAATSEVLSLIADAPTDLLPVFDRIVRNAARLCQSVLSAVYRRTASMSTSSRTTIFRRNRWQQCEKPIPPR